jgi:parallel beta-helix repeat protein
VFVCPTIVYNTDVSTIPTTASVLLMSLCLMMDSSLAENTYYVATTGNNTNTGLSTNTAFATLQHAADIVNAGDSVIVLAGRYVGVRIERSGTPDHPITFRPQLGARVVLDTKSPAEKRDGILEVETFSGNGIVSHVIVEGFEVVGAERYGVDVRSTQFVTIRGLTVSNATVSGIFTPFSHDITIENNTCAYNGEHGIYHNNSADRFIIRGNHLFENTYSGLHMNGDISVPPPDGLPWVWDGLLSDGIVENNLIHENGTGGAGINMDGVVRTIIRNNVLYATPNNSGIAVFGIDGALASQQNMFLNNVVLMAQNSGWCLNIGHGAISNIVFNNIFFHPSNADGSILIHASALEGFECDYNNVKNRFSADGDNSRVDLSTWRALGFDTHSTVSTPVNIFVSHTTRDYHLRTGSPAIESATVHTAARLDRDGVSRPLDGDNNGLPLGDIGAYEYIHATANTDGDAHTDAMEQIAGTDATNAMSVLQVSSVAATNSSVILVWDSVAGRRYSIYEAPDPATFTPSDTNIEATPPRNVFTTSPTNGATRFFRLGVTQSP